MSPGEATTHQALIAEIRTYLDAGKRPPGELLRRYFARETTEVIAPGEARLDPELARRIGPAMIAKLNQAAPRRFAFGGVTSAREATMSITDFLLARVSEDEAAAREWPIDAGDQWFRDAPWAANQSSEYPLIEVSSRRVLAECAAKRAVIAEWQEVSEYIEVTRTAGARQFAGVMRRPIFALATVYKDHPDFDPSWAVT